MTKSRKTSGLDKEVSTQLNTENKSCSVCMSFDRLGNHNGSTAWPDIVWCIYAI